MTDQAKAHKVYGGRRMRICSPVAGGDGYFEYTNTTEDRPVTTIYPIGLTGILLDAETRMIVGYRTDDSAIKKAERVSNFERIAGAFIRSIAHPGAFYGFIVVLIVGTLYLRSLFL